VAANPFEGGQGGTPRRVRGLGPGRLGHAVGSVDGRLLSSLLDPVLLPKDVRSVGYALAERRNKYSQTKISVVSSDLSERLETNLKKLYQEYYISIPRLSFGSPRGCSGDRSLLLAGFSPCPWSLCVAVPFYLESPRSCATATWTEFGQRCFEHPVPGMALGRRIGSKLKLEFRGTLRHLDRRRPDPQARSQVFCELIPVGVQLLGIRKRPFAYVSRRSKEPLFQVPGLHRLGRGRKDRQLFCVCRLKRPLPREK
jgi:hypothetical protein